MGLESMAAAGLAALGWQAAKQAINYTADAAGGALGMKVVNGTVNTFANTGATYLGSVGEVAGKVLGKAVAGQGLLEIKSQADNVSGIAKKVGGLVIDYAAGTAAKTDVAGTAPQEMLVSADGSFEMIGNAEAPKQETSSFLGTALEIGKVALPLVGATAIATGFVPLAAVGLASAVATALPKIADSIMRTPVTGQGEDAVEEILVGGAKAFIKESAGLIVGNYVRANEVIKAYNGRISQGAEMGNSIGKYLPTPIGNCFVKAGEFLGTVDAGRHAMSDAVVSRAVASGDTAETLVKTGIKIVDTVVTNKTSEPSNSWWDTARKAAWIGGGIMTGVALLAMAPEAAPFVAATSMIKIADKVASWAIGRAYGPNVEQAAIEEQKPQEAEDVATAVEKTDEKPELANRKFTAVNFSDSQIDKMIANTQTAAPAA